MEGNWSKGIFNHLMRPVYLNGFLFPLAAPLFLSVLIRDQMDPFYITKEPPPRADLVCLRPP